MFEDQNAYNWNIFMCNDKVHKFKATIQLWKSDVKDGFLVLCSRCDHLTPEVPNKSSGERACSWEGFSVSKHEFNSPTDLEILLHYPKKFQPVSTRENKTLGS